MNAPGFLVPAAAAAAAPAEGAGAQSAEGDGKKRKTAALSKKGVAGNITGEVKTLAVLQTRQLLKLSDAVCSLEGAVYDTFLGPADAPEVTQMAAQTACYSAETKAKGKGHGLGPPHLWSFGGLLLALSERGVAVGAQNAEILAVWKAKWQDMSLEERSEIARYCRLAKTYKQEGKAELRRITVCLSQAHPLRAAVVGAMQQVGWERKLGRAPKSMQERQLQDWLEALK